MRQFIGIVIFVPLAVVVGIFAVENRAPLTLEIWPLPGVHQMWASVWILGLLAVGTVVGMVIGWIAGTGARRRARRAERMNRTLERQLAERDAKPPPAPSSSPSSSPSLSYDPSATGRAPTGSLPPPAGRPPRTAVLED